MRLLLNITGIQTTLACALLQKLPEAVEVQGSAGQHRAGMEVQGSQDTDSMPGLILGSLRWYLAGPFISCIAWLMSCSQPTACHKVICATNQACACMQQNPPFSLDTCRLAVCLMWAEA